jgi:hypothetical protein
MTFTSRHWMLEDYAAALTGAGFVLDAVREVRDPTHVRWSRYPLFIHVRGIRTQAAPLRSSSVLRARSAYPGVRSCIATKASQLRVEASALDESDRLLSHGSNEPGASMLQCKT